MNDFRVRWAVPAALASVVVAGCMKPAPPPPTTRPATQAADVEPSPAARIRDLSQLAEEYASLSHQLPGRTPDEHRQLMRQVFDKLDQIFPLLADPRNNLVFREQLMAIEDSRAQLAGHIPDLVVEPTIDTGLRSAYNAFITVSHGEQFSGTDFAPVLDPMRGKLDQLDTVRGLTHQVIVAETVEASGNVVNKMTETLGQLLSNGAATQPTSAPTLDKAAAPEAKPGDAATAPPAPEKPADKSATDKPTPEKPAADTAAPDKPATDKSAGDNAAPDKPATDKPADAGIVPPAPEPTPVPPPPPANDNK